MYHQATACLLLFERLIERALNQDQWGRGIPLGTLRLKQGMCMALSEGGDIHCSREHCGFRSTSEMPVYQCTQYREQTG